MNIGVVGLGLIGGSLLQALARKTSVRGWDIRPGVCDQAFAAGIETASPDNLASWADLIFVAVPPTQTAAVVEELLQGGAAAVCDTASTKEKIFEEIGSSERFLGGHPLAGSAGSGWRDSDPELLSGASWALVSSASPSEEVFLRVTGALDLLHSPWAATLPTEHDRALARSSHLVQLLHTVLAASASDWSPLARRLSGPALRDTTRLADSPFEIWQDIISSNEENVAAMLFALGEELRAAQLAVLHPDADLRMLWRHGSLGRQQILQARWEEPVWRETSVPRGMWWQELCHRSLEGALFRKPFFRTGLLEIEQS